MPHPRLASVALAVASLAAMPSAASAAEKEGRGEAIKPVKNIPYPELHAPSQQNAGTDLEFATLTVSKSDVKKAVPGKLVDADPKTAGLQRTFSFAGSYGDGLHVIDVTEPEKSTLVATWDCGISQGDVQVFRRSDLKNRAFVAFAHDDGYTRHNDSDCVQDAIKLGFKPTTSKGGTYIAEVTDPYKPKTVSFVGFAQGSHNQTVHPSGKFLYNSNSDLITSYLPAVEIVDITNLAAPKPAGEFALTTFPGLGTESHDIGFSADGKRAYVAALSHGEILDTTDPAKPTRVGQIFDPAINVWHETEPITIKDPVLCERTFVLAEDEVAGATGTGQCPNGGVHVYDITGDLEKAPVKVGYWNIDDVGETEDNDVGVTPDNKVRRTLGTCTAHVFQLHHKEQLMTIAYYNGGVRVVDLTSLVGVALGKTGVGMKQVGWYRFPDSNTWAVKAPSADRKGFYLYGNDHRRGFDVYKWTPAPATAGGEVGTWMTPTQVLAAQQRFRALGGEATITALCLLANRGLAGAADRAGLKVAAR